MAGIFSSLNINGLIFSSLSLSHYVIVEADSPTYIKQAYAILTAKDKFQAHVLTELGIVCV